MGLKTFEREVVRQRPNGMGGVDAVFAEIAAATQLNLSDSEDRKWLAANVSQSRFRSRQPWLDYERLGDVHKAISRAARIAGYARFRAVTIEPDGSDGQTITTGLPADIVRGIYSRFGGTRGLVDRFFALMKVSGDAYLCRVRDGDDKDFDGYHFLSSDEIRYLDGESVRSSDDDVQWITLPAPGANGVPMSRTVKASDMLGRVWLPGRRWVDMPDSPLAALETECQVLWGLTESMKANIYNRFALGGLLAFPAEIVNAKVPGMDQGSMSVIEYIEKAMSRNVNQLSDATARLPILLWCKGENIENIKKIDIDREIFQTDIQLRDELTNRILFGLDIQTQATKGSEDVNHFGAWAQQDEEVRIAVQPDLDTLAWALTRLVLHDELSKSGMPEAEIARYRIAWDMSESQTRSNKQDDVRQAHDRGVANRRAVARVSGVNVDDLMDEQEQIRMLGVKLQNHYLATFTGGSFAEIDIELLKEFAKVKPGPNPDNPGEVDEPDAGPGVGDPGSPSDRERDRTGRETRRPE